MKLAPVPVSQRLPKTRVNMAIQMHPQHIPLVHLPFPPRNLWLLRELHCEGAALCGDRCQPERNPPLPTSPRVLLNQAPQSPQPTGWQGFQATRSKTITIAEKAGYSGNLVAGWGWKGKELLE